MYWDFSDCDEILSTSFLSNTDFVIEYLDFFPPRYEIDYFDFSPKGKRAKKQDPKPPENISMVNHN